MNARVNGCDANAKRWISVTGNGKENSKGQGEGYDFMMITRRRTTTNVLVSSEDKLLRISRRVTERGLRPSRCVVSKYDVFLYLSQKRRW
jgi:hypothetical protein